MKRIITITTLTLVALNISAQTLQDAQREIDNENYFKAKEILFKLLKNPEVNKSEVQYYLGNAFLKNDDADSAKVFYNMVWNPETKAAIGYLANGRLALLNKDKANAKLAFDRALQTSKFKNANIYYEAGDAYFRPAIIDLNAAISYFESAYNIDNKNTTIMLALGDAYLENSANDNTMGGKAMNKYQAAQDVNSKLPLAYIKEGRLSVRGRMYDQAIVAFNKALAIDPNFALVYKELGYAYYYNKQYDKFLPNLQKYIALSPGDIEARTTIASLLFTAKEYDKAIEEANKGLATEPNNFIFQRVLTFANFELKRYKDADDARRKFWDNPNKKLKDIDYIYAARIAAQVRDTAAAISYFNTALGKDSTNCDLLSEYAKFYYQIGEDSTAIQYYLKKKATCGTLTSLEVFYLGKSYYSVNDSLMADTVFTEFITRNAASPDGYYWRALTRAKLGKPEDFLSFPDFAKYAELASADPAKYKKNLVKAYNYLGSYYFEKKDNALSKENFTKVLELDPNDAYALEFMKQFP